MWDPCLTECGRLINEEFCSRGDEWVGIVIEGAVECGVRGETRVVSRRAQEVEYEYLLRDQPIPKVQGKYGSVEVNPARN